MYLIPGTNNVLVSTKRNGVRSSEIFRLRSQLPSKTLSGVLCEIGKVLTDIMEYLYSPLLT